MKLKQTETDQLKAVTEYRYSGNSVNNYITFNGEVWRIIGVFSVDDGIGKLSERVKIVKNATGGTEEWNSEYSPQKVSSNNNKTTYDNAVYNSKNKYNAEKMFSDDRSKPNQWGNVNFTACNYNVIVGMGTGRYEDEYVYNESCSGKDDVCSISNAGVDYLFKLNITIKGSVINEEMCTSAGGTVQNITYSESTYKNPGATLMQYLNEDYYNSLSNDAKNQIDSVKWYTGYNTKYNDLVSDIYKGERSNTIPVDSDQKDNFKRTTNWTGKIGLMYISDFAYSCSACYATKSIDAYYDAGTSDKTCINSSWLKEETAGVDSATAGIYKINTDKWTIVPFNNYYAYSIDPIMGSIDETHISESRQFKPTLYLKYDVLYKSGDGTISNPYTIE